RAAMKPVPLKPEPRPAAAINGVREQQSAIAQAMNAHTTSRSTADVEAMILGDEQAIPLDESAVAPMVAALPRQPQVQQLQTAPMVRVEPLRAPQPEPDERKFLGLFGRKKKDEPRMDVPPRPNLRTAAQAQPRDAAQPRREPQAPSV